MTIEHVRTRVQFGKPIGAFQSVQQQLAVFAGEVAAANCAARAACLCADEALTQNTVGSSNRNPRYAIAAAKLRANLAIGIATATSHQLHGAIGFTRECALHRLTRRLWAWRTEAGNDRFWSARLGAHIVGRGAETLWDDLVRV
jgi:alkylation response protein AidB-like acyl-CoA dehydrogenase